MSISNNKGESLLYFFLSKLIYDCVSSSQTKRTYFVHEYTFLWSTPSYRTRFDDKFNLNDTGYWYGGATQKTVYWPINQFVTKSQAMIPNDAYK